MIKVSDEFIVGKHNIGYVYDSFKNEFGDDELTAGSVLPFQKLTKFMSDSEILSELKVQECTLGDVLATLDQAPQEMKDGYSNIFYIKGHSRVVYVGRGGGGWIVFDWYRGGSEWFEGTRVFSPATESASLGAFPSEPLALEQAIKVCKENGLKVTREY